MNRHSSFALLALACAACGTLSPDGGGTSDLPTSGAGPYRRLEGARATLLSDPTASLDDPQAFVEGSRLVVYFTRRPLKGLPEIQRAVVEDFDAEEITPTIETVLAAGAAWDASGVEQAGLLPPRHPGDPWTMFYVSGGRIGVAWSDDGVVWDRHAGPVLAPEAGEGSALGSPAPLHLEAAFEGAGGPSDGLGRPPRIRLLYLASGAIHAADALVLARRGAPSFTRIDGDRGDPDRDPLLVAQGPWLMQIGRFTARTITTPAGRPRHDLFLSGRTEEQRVVGMAGSFDGALFGVAPAPFINIKPPEEWSPTVAAAGTRSILLHAAQGPGRSVIGAAISP